MRADERPRFKRREEEKEAMTVKRDCWKMNEKRSQDENKAGYMATPVACEWAGAVFEVT